ncbi:hypothetical protein IUK39_11150 [Priestia aryabhattai]|uniref:hypothetical protein n=1 Tax=Priestia aryabhattai TaxID=412384 RepID=UPI001C0DDC0E|nr:hypothetical protein [Priestia aryabhattai]MBU3570726.1 hypothetical protein [Priestia aryabhattai]
MKKNVVLSVSAFMLALSLSACNSSGNKAQETNKEKVAEAASNESTAEDNSGSEKTTPEEIEEVQRLEKGILLYGQSFKGGDYGSTVEHATYTVAQEDKDKLGIISARVTIKNVREDLKSVDLSDIEFSVKDEKSGKVYEGQPLIEDEQKFKQVPPGYSLTFNVQFFIKNPPKNVKHFYLYMDSSIDPFEDTHWQLDGLSESKQ